jgi:Kef-type K+ transport system membrane component KefB
MAGAWEALMDPIVADVLGIIALVTVLSAVFGAAARRLGQPAVIGQILTGIVLGPSLLGRLPGHLGARLFPKQALPYITVLGQVAVVVFMFGVGYEVELRALRGRGRAVPAVAVSAVAVPMALGAACVLVDRAGFTALGGRPDDRSFLLFVAAATAISALPVLASIVRERGLAATTPGVVATAAAAFMDVLAWLVLAAALIGAGLKTPFALPATIVLMTGYTVLMLTVVRFALAWWTGRRSVLASPVAVAFALAAGSAWVTASLGLHPIFGAFLAGLTLRGSGPPDAEVLGAMEQAGNLLLPLFFVATGLSLDVGAVSGAALGVLVLITAAACLGKLGPAYLVSRVAGLGRRDSATVAALLNTRGLTELIALNVGLSHGIITRQLFTVLVLMAVITTLMTGPLLSLLHPAAARREVGEPVVAGG